MSTLKIRASRLRRRLAPFAFLAAVAVLCALIVAGCSGSHTQSNPSATPTPSLSDSTQPGWAAQTLTYQQTSKAWTVLVYMDGANNLDTYALANLNQMEQVGSTSNMNIVVQFKRGSGYDANSQYTYDSSEGGWSGTRRYYVTKDNDTSNINSELISTNQSLDMGDYQSLQAFVQWGIASFPAQHYCLVLWDHGSGWRAEPLGSTTTTASKSAKSRAATTAGQATTRGVEFDDVSNDYIETTQLPAAINMGNGKKWDLLVYDASLMQMMEVDYQVMNYTSYIVGSEESPPGGGYPYQTVFADLNSNPSWNGQSFGTDIAQQTFAFYEASPTVGGEQFDDSYITQSVIDASKLPAVASAFNTLGSTLSAAQTSYSSQIALARADTEFYDAEDQYSDPSTFAVYESYKDGMDFTNQLISSVSASSSVVSAATSARSALQAAILYNVHGPQHPRSNGLSFYIPTPSQYATDDSQQASGGLWEPGTPNDRYASLAFPQAAPNWQTFLATAKQ